MQSLEKPCIALVEDDPVMGESLVQRLEIEGFNVNWWSTGREALEGLENVRPDLLISDLRLSSEERRVGKECRSRQCR